MRTILVAAIAASAICLSACGKSETHTYSNGEGGTVTVSKDNDTDHMTITGSNGAKVEIGGGTDVTGKLPAYLPLYPGAKVSASFLGSGQDGAGGMVTFEVQASPAEVIAFYKPKVGAAGMAQTAVMDMGDTTTYAAENSKTKQAVSVSATKGDGSTTVQLTWSTK